MSLNRVRRYRIRQAAKGLKRTDIYLSQQARQMVDDAPGTRSQFIERAISETATIRTPSIEEIYLLHRQGRLRAVG